MKLKNIMMIGLVFAGASAFADHLPGCPNIHGWYRLNNDSIRRIHVDQDGAVYTYFDNFAKAGQWIIDGQFHDAKVKHYDSAQIKTECAGDKLSVTTVGYKYGRKCSFTASIYETVDQKRLSWVQDSAESCED